MARLISKCPKCGKRNEVKNTVYMRLDRGTGVTCNRCFLRFHAALSDEDEKELYEDGSVIPVVKGEEDYILESDFYPS